MRKRVLCAIILTLITCCIGSIHTQAEENDGIAAPSISTTGSDERVQNIEAVMVKEDLNIVFVVDHSGSMNQQDKQRLIPQVLKIFVDTMHGENMRIGYVAYNDTIIAQKAPVSVQQESQRDMLKQIIDSAVNKGETDIGLGVREAYHLMDGYAGRKMIVLLSDGETDLALSNTGRTESDSEKDIEETVELCKAEGTPIVTIAFGEEYDGEETKLSQISGQTGGQSYKVQKPDELASILYDLFHTNFSYSVREVCDSVYDEGIQSINCDTGGVSYDELTILFLSDQEIEGAGVVHGERKTAPQIMGNYAVSTLMNSESEFAITFSTKRGQQINVFMIGRRNITPVITFDGDIYKNRETQFQIRFMDDRGNVLENSEYYEEFQWQAEFQNPTNGTGLSAELEVTQSGIVGQVTFDNSGKYRLYLTTGKNSENAYEVPEINILNTLPAGNNSHRAELMTYSDEQILNLDDYFEDADGDSLSYELLEMPQDVTFASIEGHLLHILPQGRGTGNIVLLVSDGEGSLTGSIPVRVRSIWEVYWQIIILLVCIVGFIIIKLLSRMIHRAAVTMPPKEKEECSFTGKINAYFTLLPEGMEEIPPLNYALYSYRDKKIVLKDMFAEYPDLIDALELDNIYLFPAENRKMILYHDCEAAVMIGNTIVCRKIQYMVSYGNVIYITSGDGTCELEVHYISMI